VDMASHQPEHAALCPVRHIWAQQQTERSPGVCPVRSTWDTTALYHPNGTFQHPPIGADGGATKCPMAGVSASNLPQSADISQCPYMSLSTGPRVADKREPAEQLRLTTIGHVTNDINIFVGKETRMQGGGVLFSGVAASNLGMNVEVITKCAAEDRPVFQKLYAPSGTKVRFLPSPVTTCCENNYPKPNSDERMQRFHAVGAAFAEQDLKQIESTIVHINPLSYGEFPDELIPKIKEMNPSVQYLVADAQGFIRHIDVENEGKISYEDWRAKEKYLKYFDLFKVDDKEAAVLTGEKDMKTAMRILHQKGAKAVLGTFNAGVFLFDGNAFFEAKFGPWKVEGRTGRGDTATASFLAAGGLSGGPWKRNVALEFAARVTTVKMQYPGPYRRPTAAAL